MPLSIEDVIREVLASAASMPHAVLSEYASFTWTRTTIEQFDSSHQWTVSYPISRQAIFCEFHGEKVQLAVTPERRDELVTAHDFCEPGQWADRGGHSYVTIVPAKNPDLELLQPLVKESAQTVWEGLGRPRQQFVICNGQSDNPLDLLDEWITAFDLSEQRDQIHSIARTAVRLGTRTVTETTIPGSTRIGGLPDLPTGVTWPTSSEGQPLAFLAQIDLSEMKKLGFEMAGIPESGLLSVFSAWGWQDDDCSDPLLIEMDHENTPAFNRLIHTPEEDRAELRATSAPVGVNTFAAGMVEPVVFAALPTHHDRPPEFQLSDEDERQYDAMTREYEDSYRNYFDLGENHQLGGYASFPNCGLPQDLEGAFFRMFLKIGSDSQLKMEFGDDGTLTFVASSSKEPVSPANIICCYD